MIRRHGFLLRAILVALDATLAVAVLLTITGDSPGLIAEAPQA